jgi:hypothetical protein
MGLSIAGETAAAAPPTAAPTAPAAEAESPGITVSGLDIPKWRERQAAIEKAREEANERAMANRRKLTEYMIAEQEALSRHTEDQINYQISLEQKKADETRAIQEKSAAETKASYEKQADAIREYGAVIQESTMIGVNALEELVLRGKDAAWRFVVDQVAAIGHRLMSKGIADIVEGYALLASPMTAWAGPGLIAAGTKEVAVGTAMAAGGTAIKAMSGSYDQQFGRNKKDGKKEETSGTGGFAGSSGSRGGGSGDSGPKQITVILQGPVYDGAAAGVAIAARLAEAQRQGLLR